MAASLVHARAHAEAARFVWIPALGGVSCLSARYLNHSFAPHAHDTFVIGVLDSGATTVRCESEAVTVGVGELLVINPGAVHSATSACADGWVYRAVYPSLSLVESVLADADDGRAGYFERTRLDEPALAAVVRQLVARLTVERSALGQEETIVELIHRVWHRARPAATPPALMERGRHGVARAKAMVDDRTYDSPAQTPPSLGALAGEAGMSRFHFIRAFAREYGRTPYAYVMERRVHEARRLLDSGARIVDAALACGFADQSHLTRHFKRIVGVTPGEYALARRRIAT
jgi:AraC-like DNA-binding protein